MTVYVLPRRIALSRVRYFIGILYAEEGTYRGWRLFWFECRWCGAYYRAALIRGPVVIRGNTVFSTIHSPWVKRVWFWVSFLKRFRTVFLWESTCSKSTIKTILQHHRCLQKLCYYLYFALSTGTCSQIWYFICVPLSNQRSYWLPTSAIAPTKSVLGTPIKSKKVCFFTSSIFDVCVQVLKMFYFFSKYRKLKKGLYSYSEFATLYWICTVSKITSITNNAFHNLKIRGINKCE